MKKSIAIIAAILVLIALTFEACLFSASDPTSVTAVAVSKNNKYLAYSYIDSGGGGPGWCQDKINIRKLAYDYSIEDILERERTVFYIDSCGNSISFKWAENEDTLMIFCAEKARDDRVITRESIFRETKIKYTGCPEKK